MPRTATRRKSSHLRQAKVFNAVQQLLADQVHFYLSPKKWDAFCAALDAPPKELPALRKLLTKPSIFDEPA